MPLARNTFLSLACVLLGVGLLMVYSSSITARPTEFEQVYLSRHVSFLGFALTCGVTAALLPAEFWRRAAPWCFALTLVLLAAVLVPGVGYHVKGAQRWLRYGSLSMQPSEVAKITLPLFVCWWLARRKSSDPVVVGSPDPTTLSDRRSPRDGSGDLRSTQWHGQETVPQQANTPQHVDSRSRWHGFWLLAAVGAVVLFVAKEPDLGTAAFLALSAALALFLAGWPLRNFCLAGAAAVPLLVGVAALRPYQFQRITGFVATWRDIDLAPYQVKQSLTTLGVGGIQGVGLGRGWQKLSFLPEANTDFVFAVVGEELGLIGTLGMLALWVALFLTGVRLLSHLAPRSFAHTAGLTLLIQLVAQAALNIAVVTAMVPPKGISLPLVSYGGSSLVASVVALGLIVSLSRTGDSIATAPVSPE
jgi:cell division protein FtsW